MRVSVVTSVLVTIISLASALAPAADGGNNADTSPSPISPSNPPAPLPLPRLTPKPGRPSKPAEEHPHQPAQPEDEDGDRRADLPSYPHVGDSNGTQIDDHPKAVDDDDAKPAPATGSGMMGVEERGKALAGLAVALAAAVVLLT
ncbi:hypothetical protein F4781DRAFT_153661 [Annulohypoxylon bovei var. microspora]|nr:hypothetical protein F4781DRAFT_153661 [Annulohypoxylon bovei var. microspora]